MRDPEGATVLVVEDYPAARKALCLLVGSSGAAAYGAEDGASALALATEKKPDLILCDLRLPRMDGFELLRRLRADPILRSIRVVAMSGLGGAVDLERISAAGFDGHLTKPVDYEMIAGLLERLLGIPGPRPTD